MPDHANAFAVAAIRKPTAITDLLKTDPAHEVPEQGPDPFAKHRKPPQVSTTALNINIPVTWDDALRRCMRHQGLEKTAIVKAGLEPLLRAYLDDPGLGAGK